MSVPIFTREIGKDVWVRNSDTSGVPGTWMHVTSDEIKPGSSLDVVENQDTLIDALVTVQREGATGYKGTIDISKSGTASDEMPADLGDMAKAVPFTATGDRSGRLIGTVVDIAAVKPGAGKEIRTFSSIGDPIAINPPPASDVIEMPSDVFEEMNTVPVR